MCWQDTGTTVTGYTYHPAYESVEIDGDTAVARLLAWVDLRHTTNPDRPETIGDGGPHVIRLVRRPVGWQLTQDEYQDEFRQMHPPGTDWAALQASYPER